MSRILSVWYSVRLANTSLYLSFSSFFILCMAFLSISFASSLMTMYLAVNLYTARWWIVSLKGMSKIQRIVPWTAFDLCMIPFVPDLIQEPHTGAYSWAELTNNHFILSVVLCIWFIVECRHLNPKWWSDIIQLLSVNVSIILFRIYHFVEDFFRWFVLGCFPGFCIMIRK